MGVEEGGHGAAGGVPSHEEGAAAAGGVFFEKGAQAGGDRADHFAGDGEEARVAQVAGVILEEMC